MTKTWYIYIKQWPISLECNIEERERTLDTFVNMTVRVCNKENGK